jgi:DNA-binding MarR family transcriptional regulator
MEIEGMKTAPREQEDAGQVTPKLMLDLHENLAYRFSMLGFALGKAVAEIYGAEGLTAHQWKVISVVCHHAPLRASQIEPLVTLDKSAISRNIQALVNDGLIKRIPTSGDARAVDVEPTPKGRKIHSRIAQRTMELQAKLLREMPAKEVQALFHAFEHLETQLAKHLGGLD